MQNVIERILNLLAFLLTVDRPVTAEEIRRTVNGYHPDNDEAWRRMFERDKDLLRNLGIPLQTRPTDAWEVEQGYVVPVEDYSLPDPGLTDEERAALWLAAQVIRIGGRPSGPDALFKLGGAPLAASVEPLAADLGTQDDLAEVFAAVSERRMLSFTYRDKPRLVLPYGLAHRRGHWYVVGPEADAVDRVKVFRLDRADDVAAGTEADVYERPQDFRTADVIPERSWEAGGDDITATVRFDAEMAWWAERQLSAAAKIARAADGSIEAQFPVANPEAFVGWLLGFDSRAELVAPPELRARLVERVAAA